VVSMMKMGKLALISWSAILLNYGLVMMLIQPYNPFAVLLQLLGIAALLMIPGAPLIVISRTRTIVGFSLLAIMLIVTDIMILQCQLWPC